MNSDLVAFIVVEILGLLLTVSSGALLVYLPQSERKQTIVYYMFRIGYTLFFYNTLLVGTIRVLPKFLADVGVPVGIMGIISLVALFGAFVLTGLLTRAWVRRRVPGAEFPPSPTRSKGQRGAVSALINKIKDL